MSYVEGDWLAECSMCGRRRLASQLVKNWQGMWRCPEHNEPRHLQDFVRAVKEQAVPWAQPAQAELVYSCSVVTSSGYVGIGKVGCMVVGGDNPSLSVLLNNYTLEP